MIGTPHVLDHFADDINHQIRLLYLNAVAAFFRNHVPAVRQRLHPLVVHRCPNRQYLDMQWIATRSGTGDDHHGHIWQRSGGREFI